MTHGLTLNGTRQGTNLFVRKLWCTQMLVRLQDFWAGGRWWTETIRYASHRTSVSIDTLVQVLRFAVSRRACVCWHGRTFGYRRTSALNVTLDGASQSIQDLVLVSRLAQLPVHHRTFWKWWTVAFCNTFDWTSLFMVCLVDKLSCAQLSVLRMVRSGSTSWRFRTFAFQFTIDSTYQTVDRLVTIDGMACFSVLRGTFG